MGKTAQSIIKVPVNLTREGCEQFFELMIQKTSKAKKLLELDGSEVERVGTAGIQLLVSIHQSCLRQDVELAILNPSNELQRALSDLGLQETFCRTGAE